MGAYEKRRILVVVKTYPNPSQTYGETVCCAGVDLDTRRWVRMYPITFRRLIDRRFAKYQIIECLATAPRGDNRPESLRVDQDSIAFVGKPLASGPAGWRRRMALLPDPDESLEVIRAAQATNGTSLGMIRPRAIDDLIIAKATSWTDRQRRYLRQQRLGLDEPLAQEMKELEQIPWTFSYRFHCNSDNCATQHELQIEDWEIGEAYRKWSRSTKQDWRDMIRQKFLSELPGRDLHLVVGNLAKHHQAFVIIGLVRPPRLEVNGGYVQQSLDFMGEQGSVAGVRIGLEAQQTDALRNDEAEESLELFPDEP
jgi:hypothetical protein